ncbi:MAG: glycosyltransferase [Ferruginibacter sp.]
MKLIFISSGKYPNGGAATNRHLGYAKGLKELGHEVEFLLLSNQQWKEKELVESGINFTCLYSKSPIKNKKLSIVQSHFKTIRAAKGKLAAEQRENVINAIVLLDISVSILIPLIKQAKKLGVKIFHERTEYPFVVSGKTVLQKIDLFIYLKYVIQKFDGIYVINNALKKYFSEKTFGKVPITIVNMLVDPERFNCGERLLSDEKVITYCGTLDDDKDGVPILIESFSLIANEFPSVKLQLIGSLDNKITRQNILSQIEKLNIKYRVITTGSVKRHEISKLLCNSYILALARPANKQAEGGFPTKLGEYLATGNTVVITNVGEIGLFLKDKQNAYIAEPNSAEKFSQKLREALSDNSPKQIGSEGRKLVFNEFNYLTQAKVMEDMFTPE